MNEATAKLMFDDIMNTAKEAPAGWEITKQGFEIIGLLLDKNIAYGNSFQAPLSVFSKVSKEEQLNVRIDDKLNRLKNGSEYPGDDTVLDLVGYLILLLVLRRKNQ